MQPTRYASVATCFCSPCRAQCGHPLRLTSMLCLLIALGLLAGCKPGSDQAGIAGRAYVEDEQGRRIPVDASHQRGISGPPARPAGSEEDWLKQFELTERSGKLVNSQELRGQPYVVSFFFTTCPTICKQQNAMVKMLQQKFKGRPLRLISITCDPQVDNPEVLSIYADELGADSEQWLFLTGDLDYLRRVGAEMFFLPVDRRFHADKLLLVDADGRIYGSYAWPEEDAWQALLRDIDSMLAAGGRLPLPATDTAQQPADEEADLEPSAE